MQRRFSCFVIGIALMAMLCVVPATYAQGQRCFPEIGQCISGRVCAFWEQNGGLQVFGFPIGPQQDATIEGKIVTAQPFERNRLELHSENQPPYDVLLGLLGSEGEAERDELTVTNRVKVIQGVACVEVHDIVLHNGKLVEETFGWYAQDKEGNVRYYARTRCDRGEALRAGCGYGSGYGGCRRVG